MKPPHKWMSDSYRSNHNKFLQPMIMTGYWLLFCLLIAPISLIGFALGAVRNWNEAIMPIFTLSAIPAWWFSKITAYHIAFGNQTFKIAAGNTFYPVLVKLAFLPLIGPYFESWFSRPKSDNPFVAQNENSEK